MSCPTASNKDFGTAVSTTSEICDVTYNEIDECYQSVWHHSDTANQ